MTPEALKMLAIGLAADWHAGPWHRHRFNWRRGDAGFRTQPGGQGPILSNMMIALALAEALGIYVLIVAILLLFVA